VVIWETPPKAAVTAACSSDAGVPDTALKDAVVAPDAMLTLGGTVRSGFVLVNEMTFPFPVAAALKVTIQAAVAPGSRFAGEQVREETTVGPELSVNWIDNPFQLAVSTAVLLAGAGLTCAVNVALLCPCGTPTVGGTVTSDPPLSAIATDSDPTRRLNVTVQLMPAPGERTPEPHVRDCRTGGPDKLTAVMTDELPTDTVMLVL
jgi:hypothetical protein